MPRFSAALVALAILSTGSMSAAERVKVDVYYEQLCPYSVMFVTQQLVPAYEYLKDYVTVNFVPFGKASYVKGFPVRFTCQHGPAECQGNKRQACALFEIQQSVSLTHRQRAAVDIVGCVMANSRKSSAALDCAKRIGLTEASIDNIERCSNGITGDELLISYGEETKAFESPLLGVPSVALNGVKNKKATEDFIGEVCHLIADKNKPAVCRQSLSEQTSR
ncbi:GILT-like protein 1 [Nasonia vitripennis]|uniref:Gamma-interferon inducible lysosomal thiol reductase n=1 Tax=Nasonia vitripennis TaxID=7425 RepID=A0A7M7G873_NASVI|nr:GILT-like protein 1 [Nasonia vitripennis]